MEIKSYKPDANISVSDQKVTPQSDVPEVVPPKSENNNQTTHIKKKFLIQKQGNENVKAPKVKGKDVPESQDSQDTKEESAKNNEDRVLREVEQAKMQELEEMIEALDPNYHNKKNAIKDVEFIFDENSGKDNANYHEEGNMDFYTKENEDKRKALKSHPLIVNALDNILRLYKFDDNSRLSKAEYVKVHTKLAKIMRKDLKEKALTRIVDQDWKHDSKGKGYMEKNELFESIFELGDVWTPEIDVYQYLAFFEKLYKLLGGEPTGPSKSTKTAKSDDPYNIMNE